MVAKKCWASSSFLWLMVVAVNLVWYPFLSQASVLLGDIRKSREVTTMYPELPQADDATSLRPQMNESDPCYRFTIADFTKKQFFSPGFDNEKTYTNNTDCVLVLQAPEGHLIKLDFRDYFHIEPSPECKNDFLEVRDGPHGYNNILDKPFCGFDFPPMLTSSDRHLWIHFKSDENIEYDGFRAVFEYVQRPSTQKTPEIIPCRIERNLMEEGFINSKTDITDEIKNFTRTYNMPVDCIWAITVKDGWRIQLQFKKFDLAKPNECDKNFVEIFSSRTDMPSLEKKFCGSIADTVLSSASVMFVRFFADFQAFKSVVEANFTAFRENDKNPAHKQGCEDDEFDCEDATCISMSLRCNGRYNCRFRWDEDDCQSAQSLSLTDDHIIIIMVIFSLILSGMCFTFIFNCIKKLIRDHHTIQEYIRQSREQQLNELDKHDQMEKKLSKSRSRSNSSPSSTSAHFDSANAATTPCYVPGGELLPILIRNERSMSPPNGDTPYPNIYTVDNEMVPEMCDSACQTRESLFTTQGYSSGNTTPNHSIHTNSPPAPFSTFGYKKEGSGNNNKFKAEAKIEVAPSRAHSKNKMMMMEQEKHHQRSRPYSVQTTKSAPDVIVTH